jgi:hypothetical protein
MPRQMVNRLVPQAPQRPKAPSLSELMIQEKLTPLVEALAHPDEPYRRAAVEHVLRTCIPAVIGRLIGGLVDLLDGAGTTQHQALASLAQFGGPAVTALTHRFMRTRSVAMQRGIVESFGEGPGESDALVKRAEGKEPGVPGYLAGRGFDDGRRAEEIDDMGPGRWYTDQLTPWGESLEARPG